jgi:rfaE bifunctional protein kinase chain/domain
MAEKGKEFAAEALISALPRLAGGRVLIEEERFMLGGAGNVARNIARLGGKPCLISACGEGYNRGRLRDLLSEEGLESDVLSLPGRPVSTKIRVMARGQQMLRVDREDAAPLRDEETRALLEKIEAVWDDFPVLIISDYNKGIVQPSFMAGLQDRRERHAGRRVKVLVDPKPCNLRLYQGMYLLTPNTVETGEAAGLPTRTRAEIIAAGQAILQKIHCEFLLTTLGARGMALFQGAHNVLHIPTVARKVFDVSGAGDTVIGVLALALASGLSLPEACLIANFAAGNVVGEVGAATTTVDKIAEAISLVGDTPLERWL